MPNWFINIRSKGAKKASKDIKGLTGNINGMASAAKKAAIVFGVGFLGKQIFDIGKSAVNTAAQFETLRVRLGNMYGSVQRGTQAFDAFNKVAATTPFQLANVVEAGASLKAFGVDAENMIKPVADLAAFMGVDVVEAAQAMGRAFAGGASAADVLRDRGILKLVEDSEEGIGKLTDLTMPEFQRVMTKALTDPSVGIAGATTKLADTWSGAVSNFQDGVDRLKAAIGDELIGFLRPKLDTINKELSKLGEIGWDNVGQSIFDNSGQILETTGTIFGIGGEIIGRKFMEGISKVIVEFSPSILQAINDMIPSWMLGMKLFTSSTADMASAVGDSLINVSDQGDEISALTERLTEAITTQYGAIVDGAILSADAEREYLEAHNQFSEEFGESGGKAVETTKKKMSWNDKFMSSSLKWQRIVGQEELKNAALTTQSAGDAMKSVVKSEIMKGISGLIAQILRNVPFPFNLIAAAGAGGMVNRVMDTELAKVKFAHGGDFVTSGPQMMMVGDNPGGQERVQITPLSSPNIDGPQGGGGITLNISAPLVDDTVVDSIIPAIREAVRRGEDIGIS